MPSRVTRATTPQAKLKLLEDVGIELSWANRAAEEWRRQRDLNLCHPGYEVQVFAMDSTFVHCRALFEFFTDTSRSGNYHHVDELIGHQLTSAVWDKWSDDLHKAVAHVQDRSPRPRSARGAALHEMPHRLAKEVTRLWRVMIRDLHGAEKVRARELLNCALDAAKVVREHSRAGLYGPPSSA